MLGGLNIGLFFALFFIAAYRLPGGVAAVLGAVGPFLVAGLAYPLLGERPARKVMIAAAIGVAGVAPARAAFDRVPGPHRPRRRGGRGDHRCRWRPCSGGAGVCPPRRPPSPAYWCSPPGSSSRAVCCCCRRHCWSRGHHRHLTRSALLGFGYLTLIGTAVAHFLWFRGVSALAPTRVTMLALLSPVVATIMGWIVLGQSLSSGQLAGAALVLGAVVLGASRPSSGRTRRSTRYGSPAPGDPVGSVVRSACTVLPRRLDTGVGNPVPVIRSRHVGVAEWQTR